jgi:heme exporter protein D
MIPDLDKYAGTVLGAYGVTIALIAGLVALSFWRSARTRDALARFEAETRGKRDG